MSIVSSRLHSLTVWKTAWVCFVSKIHQILPFATITLTLPMILYSLLSWKWSVDAANRIKSISFSSPDWSKTVVDILIDWVTPNFFLLTGTLLLIGFGWTLLTRICIDYFILDRKDSKDLILKTLYIFLRMVLPAIFLAVPLLLLTSWIVPLFVTLVIFLHYFPAVAISLDPQVKFRPVHTFFQCIFLGFLAETKVKKLDFFFLSFSTIGLGFVGFYGVEALLMELKNLELYALAPAFLLEPSFLQVSYLTLLIDVLESVLVTFIIIYLVTVASTAYFLSQMQAEPLPEIVTVV